MWREESSVASFSLPKSVALLFKQAQKLTADLKFRLPKHDSVLALSVLLGGKFQKRRDVKERCEQTSRERGRVFISDSEKEKQEVSA